MYSFNQIDIEILIIAAMVYLFLAISIAKIGTYKTCGGRKAFLVSLFLTPITGIIYVVVLPQKAVLKIVHYRCEHCHLEYTTSHKYCPSCQKEGKSYRLLKKSMRTY